jgi:phage terminase large subunit GpA-like protein
VSLTSSGITAALSVLGLAQAAWAPPPRISVSEWADAHRILSPECSAEPGAWNTDRAPFQRGPMDAISDPTIETVTLMTSAQVGKNEICHNALGWIIDSKPGPILWVAPTEKAGEKWSKTRLAPMIRDTPRLHGKVADSKSRDSGNTILEKTFPRGLLFIVGSNAPSGLASQPIQYVFCDEVDRFEDSAGTEGDILDLASKRTTTFPGRRKLVYVSTPGIKGASRIDKSWETSDQRHYFIPCPHCGKRIVFRWRDPDGTYRVVWPDGHPEKAYYLCQECGLRITDAQKFKMLRDGQWVATKPEVKGHAGFHLNELYSPWRTFGDVAKAFLKAKANGPMSLMVWVNTSLGETWDPRDGEGLEIHGLKARRERYEAQVPDGVAFLTLGSDMQPDRWEYIVRGWGLGGESWLIDRGMVVGNPVTKKFWEDVDRVLLRSYSHGSGYQMPISASAIDYGGSNSKQVLAFTKERTGRRVYAIKGASRPQQKAVIRSQKRSKLWMVDTIMLKDTFFGCIKIPKEKQGPGFVHWPDTLMDDYFDQITAEKIAHRTAAGITRRIYVKVTEDARNEALDCEVYNLAAKELLGWTEEDIQRVLQALEEQSARNQETHQGEVTQLPIQPRAPASRSRRMRSSGIG